MAFSVKCPHCNTVWTSTGPSFKTCPSCRAGVWWDKNGNVTKTKPK